MLTQNPPGSDDPSAHSAADIYTVGHSTHSAEHILSLLLSFGITRLVDVRTVPRSRHNPQFDAPDLAAFLAAAGLGYTHRPDLGGLRKPSPASLNGGWHNASFRGFADYMQTPAFTAAAQRLMEGARGETLCLMCAELLPWRCHRSLIADALVVHGLRVCHIMPPNACRAHRLTPWARVEGETITYPPQ